MAKTSARERRAAEREKRRDAAGDDSTVEEAADRIDGDPAEALRAAASAAIAGAAVGAARAFVRRHHEEHEAEHDEDEQGPLEPAAEAEPEAEPDPVPKSRPVPGGDARGIVQRAREQLRDLHGAEAESVSAVRRTADGWRVGLEVVEVHRIPESTDVLATYEVELDDDGQLLTFERTSRYYRSEADRR